MNITVLFFIILIAAWLLEWFVFTESHEKKKEVWSKAVLLKGLLSFMFLCAVSAGFLISTFFESSSVLCKNIGLFFIGSGLLLRYWTYRFTKPYFTRTIIPSEDQPLYSSGPYRFTRHPFHTGFFLIAAGTCLFISGHWLSLLFTFIFVGSALHYRMSLEEAFFQKKYGDIYVYWCRHRFRLVPFLY
ncbi:methyltransferase family protein [Evansella clarkii]|jgi:protein-S-isoprenylcysteine O-methyltransferase Ste14|uniref:methyltransferase family protein n=1 Tax=Evansella clarkii TaxID=79879 RepID=UPI000995F5AC|nr:isoprenylcysteine carboxylmethyltransferase family protein [Evansella clarkii]